MVAAWVLAKPSLCGILRLRCASPCRTFLSPQWYEVCYYLIELTTERGFSCSPFADTDLTTHFMDKLIHSALLRASGGVTTRHLVEIAIAAVLTALICLACSRYPATCSNAALRLRESTRHTALYVLAAMLVPVALRVAMLPWLPPPGPSIHDEFSHLLVADTLAARRLANPPHPLWRQLETIYVLQQPAYASIYPIGQGFILAVGKVLFGSPWAGILLAVALMGGAVTWMLFGCLPPPWAALGSGLAVLCYGMTPDWIDTYWGGAFSAFGGALLFGAFCRLRRSPSPLMALLAGLGWSVVWFTRPFESLLPCVVAWGLVAALLIHEPHRWRTWLWPAAVFFAVQVFAGSVTALHNRAVTGSFTTLPYSLSQQAYGVPQTLLGQRPVEEPPLRYDELRQMYRWQREAKDAANRRPFRRLGVVLYKSWAFYVTPWFALPVALLAFMLKDRWILIGGGIMVCAMIASALYPFFFPHYLAVYSCVILFLILRGMMALSRFSFRNLPIGVAIVLFVLFGGSMRGLRAVSPKQILGLTHETRQPTLRARVAKRLQSLGGRHMVFVTYNADHTFHDEWVYNAAKVDEAPIVWCRASCPSEASEIIRYYQDRQFWTASVGMSSVRLSRYIPGLTHGTAEAGAQGVQETWVLKNSDGQ